MSDPETREKIVVVIKEACPLRAVLRPEKACPHFGPSNSCRDCTYDWMTVAINVRKVAKIRRASYEQEREKIKDLEEKLAASQASELVLSELVHDIGRGANAMEQARSLAAAAIEEMPEGSEDGDDGDSEGENSAGEEG